MATSPTTNLPTRSMTGSSNDDAVAPGEDTSEVTRLFHERLQAFKHACRYMEDYIKAIERMQVGHGKEYDKVLKTVNQPLRESEMFDGKAGGIAEMFDSLRTNTLAISNLHTETAKTLDQAVLPMFKRLHVEIKNKQSELAKGVGKGAKAVDKARADTAKHVERLGTSSATYESVIGKADPYNDPYVLQRGVYHRLNKQLQEENSARQDMLTVQDSFSQFEAHVVQSFQTGMGSFLQAINTLADQQKNLYANVVEKTQAIDPLFEWRGFIERNSTVLIDPNAAPRTLQNTSFPNKDHRSTQPMIQGSLERKSGLLSKFSSSFFVVTPARFLHQFGSEDDIAKDPTPDLSLYLPDCTIGGVNGNLFTVKGKDISSTMSKLGQAKEYEFRARSGSDAETWWGIIRSLAGQMPSSEPSSPLSPVEKSPAQRNVSNFSQTSATSPVVPSEQQQQQQPMSVAAPGQEQGIVGGSAPPAQAPGGVPASAASAEAAKAQDAAAPAP